MKSAYKAAFEHIFGGRVWCWGSHVCCAKISTVRSGVVSDIKFSSELVWQCHVTLQHNATSRRCARCCGRACLQCVAVCCSVLQKIGAVYGVGVALDCSVLQRVAVRCSELQWDAIVAHECLPQRCARHWGRSRPPHAPRYLYIHMHIYVYVCV